MSSITPIYTLMTGVTMEAKPCNQTADPLIGGLASSTAEPLPQKISYHYHKWKWITGFRNYLFLFSISILFMWLFSSFLIDAFNVQLCVFTHYWYSSCLSGKIPQLSVNSIPSSVSLLTRIVHPQSCLWEPFSQLTTPIRELTFPSMLIYYWLCIHRVAAWMGYIHGQI